MIRKVKSSICSLFYSNLHENSVGLTAAALLADKLLHCTPLLSLSPQLLDLVGQAPLLPGVPAQSLHHQSVPLQVLDTSLEPKMQYNARVEHCKVQQLGGASGISNLQSSSLNPEGSDQGLELPHSL